MSDNSSATFYRERARDYDASAARTMALRRRTIARLDLQPGDVVLDAGCDPFGMLLDLTVGAAPPSRCAVDAVPEARHRTRA